HAAGVGADLLVDRLTELTELDDLAFLVIPQFLLHAAGDQAVADIFPAGVGGEHPNPEPEDRADPPEDLDRAGGGGERAGEQRQEGGFARAVGADHADALARLDVK